MALGPIINLAPTGMVPTRADSPHVPLSVAEIVNDVRACAELGVAIVHLHARDEDGAPTWRKEVYRDLIWALRSANPELILCVSLSGRLWADFERRSEVLDLPADLRPDMASLTLGSMNFANCASCNDPQMITLLARVMADRGIRAELEVFDTGMANYATYLADRGILAGPHYANLLFGNVATAQPTAAAFAATLELLPPGTLWAAAGIGRSQAGATAMGLALGGGVRTGLEDNLWLDEHRTQLATNRELVGRAVAMSADLGLRPAQPRAVRKALGLTQW